MNMKDGYSAINGLYLIEMEYRMGEKEKPFEKQRRVWLMIMTIWWTGAWWKSYWGIEKIYNFIDARESVVEANKPDYNNEFESVEWRE